MASESALAAIALQLDKVMGVLEKQVSRYISKLKPKGENERNRIRDLLMNVCGWL